MVKLRLPRSPFHGAENSDGTSSRGTRRSRRIQNRRMQQAEEQQQLITATVDDREEGAEETECRPENHDNNNNDENNVDLLDHSGRSSFRRMFASPGKRKPESRGITASIRRARTQSSHAATVATATSSRLALNMDEEAFSGGVLRNRNHANDFNGAPPLSLLSPNSGTLYAHAAACDALEIDDDAMAGAGSVVTVNVLQWMREDAPPELLPRILSFCGSRRMGALSMVNKKWNTIVNSDSVWRVMCEDMHKVS